MPTEAEAEVDECVETLQEVIRLDQGAIRRRVEEASLRGIAPKYERGSSGRGMPKYTLLRPLAA
ncbi:MAG: hypothetical protein QF701_03760 [Nitrospinota bacterium]|jgi:hypothetical protein|nr:hypothetical protein [Nitrospinota bacterium]MDP7371018.1 hypothetical protein [Nitrospinota bacterium]MDP7504345.1 hypothetical protein [Nitrospinota bacterium]MDP7662842.1 hypothetical protein [Nitrospinota bacterium]|tara:strand:+ start:299 stop:490 length:192 start_codon:yes stop_codon:yes gene_type:complete